MLETSESSAPSSIVPLRPEHGASAPPPPSVLNAWLRRCCWMLVGAGAGIGALHVGNQPHDAPPPAVRSATGKAVSFETLEEGISVIGYPFAVRTTTMNGAATLEVECQRCDGAFVLRIERRRYVVCAQGEGEVISRSISDIRHENGNIALHSGFGVVKITGAEFNELCGDLALRPGDTPCTTCTIRCGIALNPAGQFFHRLQRPDCEIPRELLCTLHINEIANPAKR